MGVEGSGPRSVKPNESGRQDTWSETCCGAGYVRVDCVQEPAIGSLRAARSGQLDVPTSSTVGMPAIG